MRFHALQTDPVWQDVAGNRRRIEAMLDEHLAAGSIAQGDYVVAPEMCETAWTSDRAHLEVVRGSLEWIAATARARQVWLQAGFGEHTPDGGIANSMAVAAPDGDIRAVYRKNFLFPSERAAFVAGSDIVVVDTGATKVCPLICYDLRFPELWRLAALEGAEVFAVGSSWPAVRHEHWRALLLARAIENQACLIAANRTGRDPAHQYAGGSVGITSLGERVDEAGDEVRCVTLPFDRAAFDDWRARFGALRDTRGSLLGAIEARGV